MSMKISVPSERKVLVSLFTNKINYGNSLDDSDCIKKGCTSYVCYKLNPKQSTNLHITVCGILIERDWIGFTVTLLQVV